MLTINWWLPVAKLEPCIGWQAIQQFTWGQTYASSWIHIYTYTYENGTCQKNVIINSPTSRFHIGYVGMVTTKTKTREIYKQKWQYVWVRELEHSWHYVHEFRFHIIVKALCGNSDSYGSNWPTEGFAETLRLLMNEAHFRLPVYSVSYRHVNCSSSAWTLLPHIKVSRTTCSVKGILITVEGKQNESSRDIKLIYKFHSRLIPSYFESRESLLQPRPLQSY